MTEQTGELRVAALQHDIVWNDREANFARLAPMIAAAVARPAKRLGNLCIARLLNRGRAAFAARTIPPRLMPVKVYLGTFFVDGSPDVLLAMAVQFLTQMADHNRIRCLPQPEDAYEEAEEAALGGRRGFPSQLSYRAGSEPGATSANDSCSAKAIPSS